LDNKETVKHMKTYIFAVLPLLALAACAPPAGTADTAMKRSINHDVSTPYHSGPNDSFTTGAPPHAGMPAASER
jgi:hypothetical protein